MGALTSTFYNEVASAQNSGSTKDILDDKSAQRDCRKTYFGENLSCPGLIERSVSRVADGQTDVLLRQGSVDRPKCVDLADVMYDGEQAPLYIHFEFTP